MRPCQPPTPPTAHPMPPALPIAPQPSAALAQQTPRAETGRPGGKGRLTAARGASAEHTAETPSASAAKTAAGLGRAPVHAETGRPGGEGGLTTALGASTEDAAEAPSASAAKTAAGLGRAPVHAETGRPKGEGGLTAARGASAKDTAEAPSAGAAKTAAALGQPSLQPEACPLRAVANTPSAPKPFCVWMGYLRLIAMFMVCLCHAGDPLAAFGAPSSRIWSEIYGSFVRPCVPLFVMLTGALLLPTAESFGGIFHKHIRRLFFPFVLWSVLYAAFPWLLHSLGVTEETIQRIFFPFAAPLHTDFASIGRTILLSFIQFNQYAVQLWYVYLLIGLYLAMPILSAWLKSASTRAKLVFLALWAAALALWEWPLLLEGLLHWPAGRLLFADYALRFLGAPTFDLAKTASFETYPLLGACDWNAFGMLHPFSGFLGYLVLGHLLKSTRWSLRRTLCIALPLFLLGYAIVLGGTHWMWNRPDCTAKMFEFFWWYCSLPVAMMSAGAFLLIKQLAWAPGPIRRALEDFTRSGFHVFCAHDVVVTGCYALLQRSLPTPLLLPVAALGGLTLT